MLTARRLSALLITACLLAATVPARAEPGQILDRAIPKGDVVRILERNARRVGRLRNSEPTFDAIRAGNTTIGLRAGRNIITVDRTFSRSALFLDSRGQLSATDRRALGELIARVAPQATGRGVLGTLRASVGKERAFQRRLRTADPAIDRLLGQVGQLAATARPGTAGPDEVTLWSKGNSSLSYRPGHNVIVSRQGWLGTGQAFFLEKGTQGALKLRDDSRQALRQFVTHNSMR